MRKEYTVAKKRELLASVDKFGEGLLDYEAQFNTLSTVSGLLTMNVIPLLLRAVGTYRKQVERIVSKIKQLVEKLFEEVSAVDSRYDRLASNHESERLKPVSTYLKTLVETVSPEGSFDAASINKRFNALDDDLAHVNPAFDNGGNSELNGDGTYGGDQGAPYSNWRDYIDSVRRHYPDMTDKEIEEFLDQLNGEGCGYVALINTLFSQYRGREDAFKRDFGFDMHKSDGSLNYEELLLDLYCTEDDPDDEGTNKNSRVKIWEDYLDQKDVDVDMRQLSNLTPQNFEDVRGDGEIIVGARPIRLYNEEGHLIDKRSGGHAMTVTGVTEDGLYIVSSWGEKYYIDPQDYPPNSNHGGDSYLNFTLIEYP